MYLPAGGSIHHQQRRISSLDLIARAVQDPNPAIQKGTTYIYQFVRQNVFDYSFTNPRSVIDTFLIPSLWRAYSGMHAWWDGGVQYAAVLSKNAATQF